jgi:hypothetical protein
MKSRLLAFLPALVAGLVFALVGGGAVPADATITSFTSRCNNNSDAWNPIKRSVARGYAYVGRYEGYQWGGGCWNDNDIDDAPNDPPQTYSGGEGGDCSGFTWKSWYEYSDTTSADFRWHDRWQNQHGPYTAGEFKNGVGAPNVTVAKSSTLFMDAFASADHIGMIYEAETAPGTDRIIEAKGEAYGTNIWSRTYRGNSAYSGVRRKGWVLECYPRCP